MLVGCNYHFFYILSSVFNICDKDISLTVVLGPVLTVAITHAQRLTKTVAECILVTGHDSNPQPCTWAHSYKMVLTILRVKISCWLAVDVTVFIHMLEKQVVSKSYERWHKDKCVKLLQSCSNPKHLAKVGIAIYTLLKMINYLKLNNCDERKFHRVTDKYLEPIMNICVDATQISLKVVQHKKLQKPLPNM